MAKFDNLDLARIVGEAAQLDTALEDQEIEVQESKIQRTLAELTAAVAYLQAAKDAAGETAAKATKYADDLRRCLIMDVQTVLIGCAEQYGKDNPREVSRIERAVRNVSRVVALETKGKT